MSGYICTGLFVLLCVYIVSVHALSCPTRVNQPVNITRLSNRSGILWFKNNDGGAFIYAVYNSTTGGCSRPSNDASYTTYCEAYDNKYKFTLQVHQPIEGDVYYTNEDGNDTTTIIFQEAVKIEPELKDNTTLTDEIQLKTSVNCTQLTPIFTWMIKYQNGIKATIIGRATTDTTGCDVNKTTVTSTITISRDTVKIFNDPFTVSVQLSYRECDNIYTSQPTPYFTIKDNHITTESNRPTLNLSSTSVPPPPLLSVYIGIGVGGAVVVVIIIIIICCCWKRKEKNKESESREDIARTSKSRKGINSPLSQDEIIIDENVAYGSHGGIFSDRVEYAVVNKKTQNGRKSDEIIIDENVEYVGQDDVISPPVVPKRPDKKTKTSKKEEGLKYVDVDFSNQKPSTNFRGATRQSTVNYADIDLKQ